MPALVFRMLQGPDPAGAHAVLLRRGTTREWYHHDPILLNKEVGIDTDRNEICIGDGESSWSQLLPATPDQALELLLNAVP